MYSLNVTVILMTILFIASPVYAACTETSLGTNDSVSGELTSSDCSINELISGSDVSKVDVYNLVIDQTTIVTIGVSSGQFDAFIRVYNADYSSLLAEDDDSGNNLDALIENLNLTSGTYKVLANSSTQQADLGGYTLTTSSDATSIDTILVSSVLPSSRSVVVGHSATAFATVINAGLVTATNCGIGLRSAIDAEFSYQTTDPATNKSTGTADTPADISPGLFQSYIFTITPNSAFQPLEVELNYRCSNSDNAGITVGLNTLLLSANVSAVADVVALVATVDPGVINLPDVTGTGFDIFAVASVNVGAADDISVSADTGSANLDVTILLCQTDPVSGVCINPTAASTSPVEVNIGAGETPTFAFFVAGNEEVSFDPAVNRIFIRFRDQSNAIRGATSVAARTAP